MQNIETQPGPFKFYEFIFQMFLKNSKNLAFGRCGFDYPVWTDNSGDNVDVHGLEHFNDDEEDEEDKENTPRAGDHDDDDNQPQRLRRSNGVPFTRKLSKYC